MGEMFKQWLHKTRVLRLSRHPKIKALESTFSVSETLRETKLAIHAGLDRREVRERKTRLAGTNPDQKNRTVHLRTGKPRKGIADQPVGNRPRK